MTQTRRHVHPPAPPTSAALHPRITLAHGGGGQLTDDLIHDTILPRIGSAALAELLDSALLPLPAAGERLAVTIDSFVVQPLFFPGGDIGRLAVAGTINDLSVCGARPIGLALSLILSEGLEQAVLEQVLDSIAACARQAGVAVVTGDTKVIEHGNTGGLLITTAGVGLAPAARQLHPRRVQPGDVILVSGPLAEHGLAVMLARQMPQLQSAVHSDVAPLNGLIEQLLAQVDQDVVFLRDPTRGGLAAVAAELAQRSTWHLRLDEEAIPVQPATRHAAEMLGLDVLEVANEGKVVVVVRPAAAAAALAALRSHQLGQDAAIIGQVEEVQDGLCELRTAIGGRRIVSKPYGEQLPRIC